MPTPNDQLRQARHRTASAINPDECLSRQELAEAINTYLWQHHGKQVELDANYIGKLERGVITWPCRRYREALRSLLGAPSDSALGFHNPRRAVVRLTDVDRKTFLRTTALTAGILATTPLSTLLEGTAQASTPIPNRIGATEIEHIRNAAKTFETWDFTHGGGLAREAVIAQLRWSAELLNSTCPDHLRGDLHSAVAYLGNTAAFMSFDACAHEEAECLFKFALACAEESDDWALRTCILLDMAHQAMWVGNPDEGLTYTDYAFVRSDRLTPTHEARVHTMRARVLGAMQRPQEALTAIGKADEHFAHAHPDDDPLYMGYYDTTEHAGESGSALSRLAPTGHGAAEATRRLTTAVHGYGPTYTRSKTLAEIRLATHTLSTGNPREAAHIAAGALDHTDTLRSQRALTNLRHLNQHTTRHTAIPEIADLHHRLTTHLTSA